MYAPIAALDRHTRAPRRLERRPQARLPAPRGNMSDHMRTRRVAVTNRPAGFHPAPQGWVVSTNFPAAVARRVRAEPGALSG